MTGSKPVPPLSSGLVRELEAAVEHHLPQAMKAELVAETPTDREQDDVGRELEEVEGCRSPLLVLLPAPTVEGVVAQPGILAGGLGWR